MLSEIESRIHWEIIRSSWGVATLEGEGIGQTRGRRVMLTPNDKKLHMIGNSFDALT